MPTLPYFSNVASSCSKEWNNLFNEKKTSFGFNFNAEICKKPILLAMLPTLWRHLSASKSQPVEVQFYQLRFLLLHNRYNIFYKLNRTIALWALFLENSYDCHFISNRFKHLKRFFYVPWYHLIWTYYL